MRILFVHEVSYLDKPVFEYQEFVDGLSQLGNQVAVFNFVDEKGTFGLDKFSALVPSRLDPVRKVLTFTPLVSGRIIGARIVAAVTGFFALPLALRRFKPDIIVNYSVPTFGLPVLIFSRLFGLPVVFRAIDVSHQIRKTVFSPLVKFWEKLVYRGSNHISSHNSSLLEYCISMGGDRQFTSIDYPPVQDMIFQASELSRQKSRETLGLESSSEGTTYLVLGTQFSFSGVDKLIRSFTECGRECDTLLVIGNGALESRIEQLSRGDARIFCLPPLPFEEIPIALRAADVSLVTFESNLVTNCALPQRALLSLAAGVPVMSFPLSGLVSEFGERGVHVVENYEDFFDSVKLLETKRADVANLKQSLSSEKTASQFFERLRRTLARYNRELS